LGQHVQIAVCHRWLWHTHGPLLDATPTKPALWKWASIFQNRIIMGGATFRPNCGKSTCTWLAMALCRQTMLVVVRRDPDTTTENHHATIKFALPKHSTRRFASRLLVNRTPFSHSGLREQYVTVNKLALTYCSPKPQNPTYNIHLFKILIKK
jgi:hypothetical protein